MTQRAMAGAKTTRLAETISVAASATVPSENTVTVGLGTRQAAVLPTATAMGAKELGMNNHNGYGGGKAVSSGDGWAGAEESGSDGNRGGGGSGGQFHSNSGYGYVGVLDATAYYLSGNGRGD